MTAPSSPGVVLPSRREWLGHLALVLAVWVAFESSALSQGVITLETTPYPINLAAGDISTWQKEGIRVLVASGNVWITQGKVLISADSATLWFYEQEALQQKEAKVEVYCTGQVTLVQDKDVQHYEQIFVRLETTAGLALNPVSGKVRFLEEEQPLGQADIVRREKRGEFTSREPVVRVAKEPDVVDIVADDIDSWVEGDKRIVTALGNVVLHKNNTTLEADNAILWFEDKETDGKKKQVFKEIYAEGNVTLRSAEEVRKADKIFQSFIEKKALYTHLRIKTKKTTPPFIPIFMGGEEAKQVDPDHLLIKDAYFTTCSFGHPHYRFKSRNLTVTRRKTPAESYTEMVARNDTFLVGDLPIAYVPKYTYDSRTKPGIFKGAGIGSSTRFGRIFTTTWDPLALGIFAGLNSWSHLITKLDYLSKRGPVAASEFFYERPDLDMKGTLETFFVRDHLDRDLQPAGDIIAHENRGRILWRNRENLDKYWRADAELSYLSDRGFLREYFEKEFKTGKEQETDFYLRRLEDNKSLTFLMKKQIHKFDTGSEALPQLGYQLISQPLWEDRLNFTSQSELGYRDFHLDDELNVRDPVRFNRLQRTTGNSLRMDNNNTLSWPFQLGILKLKPFVGGRLTAYSKSLENQGPNDGPPVGRLATSLGMDASTNLWRIYSLDSKLLHIHRLKHIITPELRLEASPTVTQNPDDLLQYEPADALHKYNALLLGVRNRFQTRRGPASQQKTIDLFDLDMKLHLLTHTEDPTGNVIRTVGNAEGFLIPSKHSFIQPDFRSQLTDRIALVSERNEFNLDKFTFDVLSFGVNFQNAPQWSQFIGYRFLKDISSTLIYTLGLLLKEKWGLSFSETYDFRPTTFTGTTTSAQSLHTGISLSRLAHEWTGSLNLGFDPVNRNTTVKFDITPIGVRQTPGRKASQHF